jgi:Ca2+-binding EF-hand superfamily protein
LERNFLVKGLLNKTLTYLRGKFPNIKRYFSMKLQVLFGVYACILPFQLQAEESSREKPAIPRLEKRPDDRRKDGEKDGETRRRPEGHQDMFGMMDKNRDGVITPEEFFAAPRLANMPQQQRDKFFARIDLDGDGKVTAEEIRKMRQETHNRKMRELRDLDMDKSGGLNFEEFSQGKFFSQLPEEKRKQIFARMDTNSDGQITAEDRPKGPGFHPEHREERKKFDNRPAGGQAPSAAE